MAYLFEHHASESWTFRQNARYYANNYVRGDMVLFYCQRQDEVGLNFKNITNAEYVAGILSQNLVYLGEQLSVFDPIRLKCYIPPEKAPTARHLPCSFAHFRIR